MSDEWIGSMGERYYLFITKSLGNGSVTKLPIQYDVSNNIIHVNATRYVRVRLL